MDRGGLRLGDCQPDVVVDSRELAVRPVHDERTTPARWQDPVFRRIYKLHKANGLFLRQIISHRHLLLGGNPGPPTVWRTQEQRRRPLFSAVLVGKKSKNRNRGITAGDRFVAPSDRLRIPATISQQRVIVNLINALLTRPGLPLRVATAAASSTIRMSR